MARTLVLSLAACAAMWAQTSTGNISGYNSFWGSTFLGNNITGTAFLFFGTTKQSSDNALTTAVNTSILGNPLIKSTGIVGAMGANLTAARRTASIMSLNLEGTRGTAPQVLARSTALRTTLKWAAKIGTGALLVDAGLTLGEAINCR